MPSRELQSSLNDEQRLAAFFNAALRVGLPVALWRLPGERRAEAIVALSPAARAAAVDFPAEEPAFLFAPFTHSPQQLPLHIPADVRLLPGGQLTQAQLWNGQRQRYEDFLAALAAPAPAGWYVAADPGIGRPRQYHAYCDLVAQAVEYIAGGGAQKIVLSRTVQAPLPADFTPVTAFNGLCRRYSHAFVSLVALPGVGVWMGASPELLLAVDCDALRTVALAGTQARLPHRPLSAVVWRRKEIDEQALVADYIRAFFRRAGVQGVQETGPSTVAAGAVVHLRSDFRVASSPEALLPLAGRVVTELHPTPAVCGAPKEQALGFIRQHEGYDRRFYSGYLGPVHIDRQSHLYVNLRCMQLGQHAAYLYVGGGVTGDSSPHAEWGETELKARTLLDALCPMEKMESQS